MNTSPIQEWLFSRANLVGSKQGTTAVLNTWQQRMFDSRGWHFAAILLIFWPFILFAPPLQCQLSNGCVSSNLLFGIWRSIFAHSQILSSHESLHSLSFTIRGSFLQLGLWVAFVYRYKHSLKQYDKNDNFVKHTHKFSILRICKIDR